MYEMYPDAWPATVERRQQPSGTERPRRRTRRMHSVLPVDLSAQPAGRDRSDG